MTMQALNHLVARSIIDPSIVEMFSDGQLTEAMEGLDFTVATRTYLSELEVESWADFAIQAYRYVKESEEKLPLIELPSPLEGIVESDAARGDEQVA